MDHDTPANGVQGDPEKYSKGKGIPQSSNEGPFQSGGFEFFPGYQMDSPIDLLLPKLRLGVVMVVRKAPGMEAVCQG